MIAFGLICLAIMLITCGYGVYYCVAKKIKKPTNPSSPKNNQVENIELELPSRNSDVPDSKQNTNGNGDDEMYGPGDSRKKNN
jgi:hypothetical protein